MREFELEVDLKYVTVLDSKKIIEISGDIQLISIGNFGSLYHIVTDDFDVKMAFIQTPSGRYFKIDG